MGEERKSVSIGSFAGFVVDESLLPDIDKRNLQC